MPKVLIDFLTGLSNEDAFKIWTYVADGDDPPQAQMEIKKVLEHTHVPVLLHAAKQ